MNIQDAENIMREAQVCLANHKDLLKRLGLDSESFERVVKASQRTKGDAPGAQLREKMREKRVRMNSSKREKFRV